MRAALTLLVVTSLSGGCLWRASKSLSASVAGRGGQPFVPPFAYEAYVRGELALAQGDPEAAALQFELATAAPEEDAYLLSRLADAQAQTGDRPLAERTLREAERVRPCQQDVWLTRGGWAEQDGDLDTAEQAYLRALGCQPGSDRALLALHRVLLRKGEPERALQLLTQAGQGRAAESDRSADASRAKSLFAHSLRAGSLAETRFAFDSWLSLGPPDRALLEEAVKVALNREPGLALSVSELSLPGLTPAIRARLALAALDVATARALLAQHHESELGGPALSAQLAQLAGDHERAELYASLSLQTKADDALRVLQISSHSALGDVERVLEGLPTLQDPALRRSLTLRELEALGMPSLARELSRELK